MRAAVCAATLAASLIIVAPSAASPLARAPRRERPVAPTRSAEVPRAGAFAIAASGSGVPVTMPPVGLSFEYPVLAADLGSGPCPPPALVAELTRLGSPPLALGGASQDLTAPTGALPGSPSSWETSTLYTLTAPFWSQLHCLLSATREPLTVGINAKTGAPAWAGQIVAGAQAAATNGLEFSLGNEPDRYVLPNYPSLGERFSEQEDIAAENIYLQLAGSLQQATGSYPLIGPELSDARHWQRQLPSIIARLHEQTVGVHLYAFSACKNPRAATIPGLLSPRAAEAPRQLAWVVADASAAGIPAIISESNSISCGGIRGVSDSPAAAVWAVRFVLSALKTGFRQVRIHLSGGSYDPFFLRGEQVVRRPLESALVALDKWLPMGSTLSTSSGPKGLLATAVSGDPGGPKLILDNEQSQARRVVLAATQPVTVELLSAGQAGLRSETIQARNGRATLRVGGNSVAAVMP
jgi:hypothetical protein